MSKLLDTIPHPLTPASLDQLTDTAVFCNAHPEVIGSRYSKGEGTAIVVPAFLLVTETAAYAIVETIEKDSYRVLKRTSADNIGVARNALSDWCDAHGYV